MTPDTPIGGATTVVAAVRAGAGPGEAVERSLAAIAARDAELGAFAEVRADAARAEAAALAGRSELRRLPLAGVPVAVKELLDPDGDHVVVRRLREAGAVVVGRTRMPQACLWPATDGGGTRNPWVTRNPWSREFSAGGSSGGAGAAVAAGLVPMAHGTDGLGSVRIPAACCGLVGVKPGRGVVAPVGLGGGDWFGLTEHGVLATTVADAALMLSVLAADPALARVEEPEESLRIAVAVNPPLAGVPVDTEVVRATFDVAAALGGAGDRVERTRVPYPVTLGVALSARWFGAAREEIEELAARSPGHPIEPRASRHAALDGVTRPLLRSASAAAWEARAMSFFGRYDVLVTPLLATGPLRARAWSGRGWAANVAASVLSTGGFAAAWNLAGFPALTVPAGVHPRTGLPIGVQLAGPPGSERLLLGVASTIERLRPWPPVAPA
jgi:amidase